VLTTLEATREDRGLAFIVRLGLKRSLCLILLCFDSSAYAATWQTDGTANNVQYTHDNLAHNGDTITLPAGTFSWTASLNITKAVTLQGQTTISGAGTANPVINDLTIIKDNTPRSGTGAQGIITVTNDTGATVRITGLTFVRGTATTVAAGNWGAVRFYGGTTIPSTNNRIDHCHFNDVLQYSAISSERWIFGVADHNVIKTSVNRFIYYSRQSKWGGPQYDYGNASWADYPYFGTNKFWFLETNTIDAGFGLDGNHGQRYVLRYNYCLNTVASNHGTEGGLPRGGRAYEVYGNTFKCTTSGVSAGYRAGTALMHDNTRIGTAPGVSLGSLVNDRQTSLRPYPIWGTSDGTSIWDKNDTEGNGTFVEGHPPFLYASGTDTSSVNSFSTVRDNTKNWTSNQWVGYSVTNTNPASPAYKMGSAIVSNTSNTITYQDFSAGTGGDMFFNAGDSYKIHRVLFVMDQCAGGKTDLIKLNAQNNPINTTTGVASYAHTALEPCYSWNNVYTPTGASLGWRGVAGMVLREGKEYYNLGKGFTSTPQQVKDYYNAARNGIQYNGDFVYPHPLVSGAPQPTPTVTPTPTPAPPSGLTATAAPACLQIKLSWRDNSTNEDGFKIERSVDNITFTEIATVPANTTTYTAQQTQAGLRYFRVRAYNVNGSSPYSNTASSSSGVCPTPSPPTNLTAAAASSSRINLSWQDNSNNETGFVINRTQDPSKLWNYVTTVGANVTSYSNTGLHASTIYYYRVRAINAVGGSAWSNTASAKTQ